MKELLSDLGSAMELDGRGSSMRALEFG